MSKVESTGEILTIGQREIAAGRHIADTLGRARRQLLALGNVMAARHIESEIQEIPQFLQPIHKGGNP